MISGNKFKELERRHTKRFRTELQIEFKDAKKKTAPTYISTTRNISCASVFFESPVSFTSNSLLNIKLYLLDKKKPISITIKTIRSEEIIEHKAYLIGAIFEKITNEDFKRLSDFLKRIDINPILKIALKNRASDIHLMEDQPPVLRVDGILAPIKNTPPLSSFEVKNLIYNMLSTKQQKLLERDQELDTSFAPSGEARFRVNMHYEKSRLSAAIRIVPVAIPSVQELALPPIIADLTRRKKGIIFVTGPAGCGKTTTQAAMINLMNKHRNCMILSVEDPIEYVHNHNKAYIKQREVGADTKSFAAALRRILRQDPNVLFIGETRDLESIQMAITAAETGHLVLTTLHTIDAVQTINRIIDMFPPEHQRQVRIQLADSIEAVISQQLLRRRDKKGRIVATEVLVATPAVRNIIRSGDIEQLYSAIQTGGRHGMHSMDMSLARLVTQGYVEREFAMMLAKEPEKLF